MSEQKVEAIGDPTILTIERKQFGVSTSDLTALLRGFWAWADTHPGANIHLSDIHGYYVPAVPNDYDVLEVKPRFSIKFTATYRVPNE